MNFNLQKFQMNARVKFNSYQYGSGIGIVKGNPGGTMVYIERVYPSKNEASRRIVPHSDVSPDDHDGFFLPLKDVKLCEETEVTKKD